jgi:uncharacterized peroxidase-related enzyme
MPDRAMLTFAVKLTRTPGDMTAADAQALREAGFEDAAILDITQITAYYGYVNRLADGLGVELEEWWTPETLVLSREAFEARRARRSSDGR